jgi:hypothetical protein
MKGLIVRCTNEQCDKYLEDISTVLMLRDGKYYCPYCRCYKLIIEDRKR